MRLALTLLLASMPLAAHAGSVEVTASRLNVRSSAWGRVVGQVPRGTRLASVRQVGGWHEVYFGGSRAYVSGTYTRANGTETLRVTASTLNVRSGPGTSNSRIGQVSRDQVYVRVARRSGWSQIQFDHRKGWVHERYVHARGLSGVLSGAPDSDGSTSTVAPGGGAGADATPDASSPGGSDTNPSGTPGGTPSDTNPSDTNPSGTPSSPDSTGSTLNGLHRGLSYMGAQIPRAGLYNSILRRNEPYGPTRTFRGLPFVLGKVSHFGGPTDRGVTSSETGTITGERLRSLHTPMRPNASQLRSRPADFYYVAMRWDYRPHGRTFWRRAKILVVAPSGRAVVVRPVDWGPHTRTRRIIDLSPQAVRDLGLRTDQQAYVAFADPSAPLGPVR
jgi:uncharacterized protein YraI